jgi:hypothetical protein
LVVYNGKTANSGPCEFESNLTQRQEFHPILIQSQERWRILIKNTTKNAEPTCFATNPKESKGLKEISRFEGRYGMEKTTTVSLDNEK